ncbi:MAG: O-antigen ligase family protein [Pseudomonas sp.]|nr:O-antigen ligase family protein [Pseudomonas sp.]
MTRSLPLNVLFFIVALCVFSSSALFPYFSMYSWHDHQRIAEVFILCVICILYVSNCRSVSFPMSGVVFLFFLVGLFSSFCADYLGWALKEWARFFGLFVVVVFVAKVESVFLLRQSVFFILFLCGFFLSFQFINYYLMAFLTGIGNLSPYLLLYGFDNPRFLGQFQVVLLPMLSVFLLRAREGGGGGYFAIAGLLLVQWAMAWSMGGRGMFLGFSVALLSLFFIRKRFFNVILIQLFFAFFGYLLCLFLFKWIPFALDIKVVDISVFRDGLSGRELIWQEALGMIFEYPVLGVGPMHYSAVWNNVAAHPHQLLLLVFSEWGGIAGVIFIYLVFSCFRRGVFFLRGDAATDLDAGVWLVLVSAFVLGQVDGVLVMPYGEVWLAIIAGVALGRWKNSSALHRGTLLFVPFALLAFFVLSFVLFVEAPSYLEKEASFIKENAIGSPPRFWGQGWIPM